MLSSTESKNDCDTEIEDQSLIDGWGVGALRDSWRKVSESKSAQRLIGEEVEKSWVTQSREDQGKGLF